MPLEAGDGFISGLVATNPVNATDQVAQGDDHIRLIKTAVKGSFPNVNGAVNFTPAQANILVTDGAGAGMLADIAAIVAPGADRILGWDFSATAAIAFTLGSGLTISGTSLLVDSAIVPLLGSSNTFTGATQGISNANDPAYVVTDSTGPTTTVLQSTNSVGLAGTLTNHPFDLYSNGELRFRVAADGSFDFKGGTVTTNGASAAEVGYNGAPQNVQNGDYTLVLTDRGKTIYKASGGAGETITIPANASVAFPIGTIIRLVNNGGGDLTIAITSDTLSLAGVGTTGSRTLSDHGVAAIEKVSSTEWFISGVGLS